MPTALFFFLSFLFALVLLLLRGPMVRVRKRVKGDSVLLLP